MMCLCVTASDWLSSHSAAVQAAAAVVSILLTAVLVVTTILYLRTTNRILEESRKSREAAERQASAAQNSIILLRQQLEEQLGLGRGVVKSTVESAISAISYWKQRPLTHVAKAPGLPPTDDLVPANALTAVEHARRIFPEAAEQLSSAFDDLRNAVNEIERTRFLGAGGSGRGFFEETPSKPNEYLDSAFKKLQRVMAAVV